LKPKQYRRMIALARLVTHASQAQFDQSVSEYIDLEEFARFLACQVILANYDGFLSNGQNFLIYLDPNTEKFGFVPWDLDHCWGEFPFVGTLQQREQASLWHPWVGGNRFLERIFGVPQFRELYKRELARVRNTLFIPERLSHRLDELAAVVRPFVTEESSRRLSRFSREIAEETEGGAAGQSPQGFNLNTFFIERAASVSAQIEGRSQGVTLTRRSGR